MPECSLASPGERRFTRWHHHLSASSTALKLPGELGERACDTRSLGLPAARLGQSTSRGESVSAELDFEIVGGGPLAEEVRRHGFDHFLMLAEHVRQLPYGRPSCARDVSTVLEERRGTCSSKHRLLAAVAHECGHPEVDLVVGLYAMSERNTPGVGVVLEGAGFVSIPEAHCYLRLGDRRHDFTGLSTGASSPFEALLSEHLVPLAHLPEEKARLHHDAIRVWSASHGLPFADAWALREACIQALVSSHMHTQTEILASAGAAAARSS